MQPTPLSIKPHTDYELFVAWNTGEEFKLPYLELRFHCPCAGCVDEHTGKRMIRRDQIQFNIKPRDVRPVGRYAVQITWSDGHSTGMFHFDSLYELCKNHGFRLDGGRSPHA